MGHTNIPETNSIVNAGGFGTYFFWQRPHLRLRTVLELEAAVDSELVVLKTAERTSDDSVTSSKIATSSTDLRLTSCKSTISSSSESSSDGGGGGGGGGGGCW